MSQNTLSPVVGSPRELLEAALPLLERIAEDKRATALEEHDLQEALEQAAGAGSAVIALKHWPEVGPFDVVIDDRIAIELQFCQSGDGLAGIAWDIAKLATARAERKIEDGWIIAAAPSWHWQSRRPGVELIREHKYVGDELVEDYEGWWRLWCNEITTRSPIPTASRRASAASRSSSASRASRSSSRPGRPTCARTAGATGSACHAPGTSTGPAVFGRSAGLVR
jgi:hypothetical protein